MTILSKKFLRRSVRKLSLLLLRFQCQLYTLLLLNWQLLGVEMKLGQPIKQDSGTVQGCSRNFPTSTPITFIGEYPRGSKPPPPPHNNRHPDFPRVPLLASVKAKSAFFFQYIGQKPALLTEEKNIHITSFGLFGVIDLYRRTSYATSPYKRPPPIGDHQSASYLNTNISPVKSLQLTPLENDQPF